MWRIRLGAVLVAALGVTVVFLWQRYFAAPPLPALKERWWGPGEYRELNSQIRPFKISVPDEVLKTLNDRLDQWKPKTKPLEKARFTYGFNSDYLKEVVQFWRTSYDWRKREAYLNQFPQFKTYISGLDLHYIHVKPKNVPAGTRVLPLLLLHGWPGSVREFYEAIPLLTTPRKDRDFVFEVVVPSLPGYGFSEGASKPGLGPAQMALVLKSLMIRVGHKNFYVQGGDWGALLTTILATLYPANILGAHSNMCNVLTPLAEIIRLVGSIYPPMLVDEPHINRTYPMSTTWSFLIAETGYFHIQATKPDTVGTALLDSPVGLAAYILEKFSTWTNIGNRNLPDGGLTNKFSLENLLDNIMIYYVSDSIMTSMRLYAEGFAPAQLALGLDRIPTNVPTACAAYPSELLYTPRAILVTKYTNMVHYSHPERGGHFAAFEEPQLFADDVFEGFSKILASTAPSA